MRHTGPRVGSCSRMILDALSKAPNHVLSIAQAKLAMPLEYRTVQRFDLVVMQPLEAHLLAITDGVEIRLLPAGKIFLQQAGMNTEQLLKIKPAYKGQITPPRQAPIFKPMTPTSFSKLMAGGPQRAGMDDLRDCPSLMGTKRVAPGGIK